MSGPIASSRLVPLLVAVTLLLGVGPLSIPAPVASAQPVPSGVAGAALVESVRAGLATLDQNPNQTGTGEPAIGRSSYESPLGYRLD